MELLTKFTYNLCSNYQWQPAYLPSFFYPFFPSIFGNYSEIYSLRSSRYVLLPQLKGYITQMFGNLAGLLQPISGDMEFQL